ncbi:MAG: carboxylating nicotinate-nucleotide diphosphorylase [Gammaproteobacteria bacterium]|nr:carboxylating nicotinate-nucleotide diphosphorylase [Gammaproteobacteria bacterium]MDP7094044.1 carboxylating nicotinate-nucleotide diphosphorylase [Gammaproteobacteria bacterium]MDP7270363.1 carboxylating nicotinate-nucleotide diphosphorylase [Gammaproteobacteria bacterium]HJP04910.1 carboxylating nicotinate-nucleotide diphosphorylase [Gammaproteobacteria bacterium]
MTEITPELASRIIRDVEYALVEDIGSGDITARLVPDDQRARAVVQVRDDAVLCGSPWFEEVFTQLSKDIRVRWNAADGDLIKAGSVVCELEGPARPLLTGERTALNFLQTLSASATATRAFSIAIENTGATILDTRKTLPGLRLAQKYAVKTGGGMNHRKGLYDAILIKENHILSCGSISNAVKSALKQNENVPIVVEVENLDEAREAIEAGANQLLLDNFDPEMLAEAVALRNQIDTNIKLEASGGISLDSVQGIAEAGVDYISVGTLTKDIRAIDLSMRFEML